MKMNRRNFLFGSAAKIKSTYRLDTAAVQLYKSPNQVRNFVECVISRKPTISPAEVGARGAVPRTNSGPEDPAWLMNSADLRAVNEAF